MKHPLLALGALCALSIPVHAEPRALGDIDYCATYTFAIDGKGEQWTICRSGSRVFTEEPGDLHTREIWDQARAYRVTIYVKARRYVEDDQSAKGERARDALRPRPVKMMALLTDPEIYVFERVGTETLDGRKVVKWRVTVRAGKEHLAFVKRGYLWTGPGDTVLKIEGDYDGKSITLIAAKFEAGPVKEELFQIPKGYRRG